MDNWIELEAPNGEWVEFNIAGEQPTQEELDSFNKILSENYSEKDPLRTENNPISSVKSSMINNRQTDDSFLDSEFLSEDQSDAMKDEQLNFLLPDAPSEVQTDNAPTSSLVNPVEDDTINNQSLNLAATPPNEEPKEIAPEVISEVQPLSDPSANEETNTQEAASAIEPVSTDSNAEQLELNAVEDAPIDAESTEPPEPIPDLKIPTLELYNSIDAFVEDEDARLAAKKELYMTYASHPDAKVLRNNNGDIISIEYKNTVVPEPAEGFMQEADGFLKAGVWNFAYNIAELGLGVTDWARSLSLEEDEKLENSLLEEFREEEAKYRTDSTIKTIGLEGAAMVTGGGALASAVRWATNGLRAYKSGKWFASLSTFLGFEAGAAASMSSDTSGLFVGKDPFFETPQKYFPLLEGVQIGDDFGPEEYEALMNNKLNLLIEAAALTKPLQWGVEGITWGGYLVHSFTTKPLLGLVRDGSKEEIVVRQIAQRLVGATDASTPEQKKAILMEIVDAIEANKDVLIPMGNVVDEITFTNTTMASLERALAKGDNIRAAELIAEARAIEKGAISSGMFNVQGVANKPLDKMSSVIDETEEVFGGQVAVDNTAAAVREAGELEVGAARLQVDEIEQIIAEQTVALDRLIKENPAIANQINKISNDIGFDISAQARTAEDGIVGAVSQAYEITKKQRNDLYAAIRGGDFTEEMQESLITQLRQIDPARLDIAASAMPDGPLRQMILLAKPPSLTKVVDGATVRKTAEEIAEDEAKIRARMMAELAKAGVTDFGSFYTQIRSPIASVKNDLFKAGEAGGDVAALGAGRQFDEFVKFVDDIESGLLSQVDETVQDAVAAAKRFDREVFVPNFKQGPLKQVADLYERTNMSPTTNAVPLADEFQVGVRETILPSLANNTREYGIRLVDVLSQTGQNANAVKDYIIYKSLEPIGIRLMNSGEKLTVKEVDEIVAGMQNYSAVLKDKFPEAAVEIDALVNQVLKANAKDDILLRSLEKAKTKADEVADNIFNNKLRDFFQREGVPVESGQKAFNNLFAAGMTNRFDDIVSQIRLSGDPILIDGLKAAMIKRFDEVFITNGLDNLGAAQLSNSKIRALQRDLNPTFQQMEAVFSDSPEFVQGVRALLEQGGLTIRRRSSQSSPINSVTAEKAEAIRAVNTMVNVVIGPLNRRGAQVRALGSNLVTRAIQPEEMRKVMSAMLANPDDFVRVARRVFAQDTPMDEIKKTMFIQFLLRSGLYNSSENSVWKDADIETVVNTFVETEAMINDTVNELTGNTTVSEEEELLEELNSIQSVVK